jgi:hypothetical protein
LMCSFSAGSILMVKLTVSVIFILPFDLQQRSGRI